jgi:tetratricopeptide (TPR) repeat protein
MALDSAMRRCRYQFFSQLFVYSLIGSLVINGAEEIPAQPLPHNTDQAISPLTQLHNLLAEGNQKSADPAMLLQLADLYLEIGQNFHQEESRKRGAFEEGARLAKLVLENEEHNAEAHFLYAANLGSSAQIAGFMASAMTVNTLKTHVQRALDLDPGHARALHMMGMMLEELPWFLGGDKDMAITYLVRATEAKPDYIRARLDLAKIYMNRQKYNAARSELLIILDTRPVSPSSESRLQDQQEAKKLLDTLAIHH